VMDAGKDCFGWMRSFSKENVEGTKISFSKKGKGKFEASWFDTWTGKTIKTETVKMNKGKLILAVPKTETAQPDIAFKIRKN
jgi:hypothetical protein